ncbi:hypothetical protein OA099_03670 [Litorivicinus sp.]|nr:hypothetical protein [Litorivicinus sp.]
MAVHRIINDELSHGELNDSFRDVFLGVSGTCLIGEQLGWFSDIPKRAIGRPWPCAVTCAR